MMMMMMMMMMMVVVVVIVNTTRNGEWKNSHIQTHVRDVLCTPQLFLGDIISRLTLKLVALCEVNGQIRG